MIILGIETSCDETALALYDLQQQVLIDHIMHSQIEQLTKYGGVIPEVAARYHIQYLTPLLLQLLTKHNLSLKNLGLIAYTKGPGLIGSLLTGIAFAKSLSFALQIPAIGIHHLEGHILACMIDEFNQKTINPKPQFPFLALVASGGHTMLIKVNALGDYKILGETLDDAAGEALDKTAKLLELNPPTGKTLAELAATSQNPKQFYFTRPLSNKKNLQFSFSGLKTAAMLKIKSLPTNCSINIKADLAYAFQAAIMDLITIKCRYAIEQTNIKQLVIAGGVSANLYLRTKLLELNNTYSPHDPIKLFFPKLEFCTDNAAMIAIVGALRFNKGLIDQNLDISALPRWDLSNI